MLTDSGFDKFRAEAELALQELATKWNVNIKSGHITYDANSFSLTIKVAKKEVNGVPFEQAEFERNCGWSGLQKSDYLKSFIEKGRKYTIIGIKTSSKYDVTTRRDDDVISNWKSSFVKSKI
jgi:hypothetical protein